MSLKLKRKKASAIPPLEGGTYMAVCVGVIDIGEQKNERYNNYAGKVILIFEIPSETVEVDGEQKPRWISETYTTSLAEKANLYKILISWRGKNFTDAELNGEFELSSMLGAGAMIQVILTQKEERAYNNIAGVTGIPKGFPAPVTKNELLLYDMDAPDEAVFDKLPEWIRERIMRSTEYQETHTASESLDIDPDPAPAEERKAPF